jgi:hypothetical protein
MSAMEVVVKYLARRLGDGGGSEVANKEAG